MALTTIEKLQRHAKRIASGQETVKPGMPARFTEACVPGDCIWQGDLGLEIVTAVPAGLAKLDTPKDVDRQLVPGNTTGAKHCLDSLDGVTLYRPENWSEESLDGPCLVLAEERTVTHPVHGAVTIPAGFIVQCHYQREFDAEQRRAVRSRD